MFTRNMEIVATTIPSVQDSFKDEDPTARLPYVRIVSLWHKDGHFGRHLGAKNPTSSSQRTLKLPEVSGQRLMDGFEAFLDGEIVNCHKFGRIMLGMEVSLSEPVLDFSELEPTPSIQTGATSIIGVTQYGIPHTLGYGLGDESLQVMSSFGEFGIARDEDVLDFYKKLYPDHDVSFFQVPTQ